MVINDSSKCTIVAASLGNVWLRMISFFQGAWLLVAVLHLFDEPGELLQLWCHDDSIVKIIMSVVLLLVLN